MKTFNVEEIRKEFPFLSRTVNKNQIVYFDNAATSQKPKIVLNALNKYYTYYNSNVHRGVHTVSQEATDLFEKSRIIIQKFINAPKPEEIIYTKGTTEAINLIANCFCAKFLEKNDEIIISSLEHHSNIVPWQMECEKVGAKLKIIPLKENQELDILEFEKLLNKKVKIVSLNHISNSLGIINDIKKIITLSHKLNIPVLIDGAQSAPHLKIDVQDLDVDFYCFSGHKMYGPTGTGILYGKEKWLNEIPPYHGGGEMIKEVTFEKTTYNILPFKFEAGTPNISGAIVLAEAVNFIESIGHENILNHENELRKYATKKLKEINNLKIYGDIENKGSVISFNIEKIHAFDLGLLLDKMGIAMRTGHHCTQPLMNLLKISGTLRASFAIYNTKKEVDYLIESIKKAINILK